MELDKKEEKIIANHRKKEELKRLAKLKTKIGLSILDIKEISSYYGDNEEPHEIIAKKLNEVILYLERKQNEV